MQSETSILTAIHMHFFCETIFAKKLTRETNVSDSVQKSNVMKSALSITILYRNMRKFSCVCIWRERMIPEEIRSSGCGNRSRGCIQQNPVQPADGPAHAVWRQPNTCPVDCGSAHGKNSGYATGNLSSALHQETMDVPKWSPLSPVLFNVFTKGLADLNRNGLIYKTSRDSQEAAGAVQEVDGSVSHWYHGPRSLINPDKAQPLWCTLDNRAAGKPIPAVTFDGAVVEWRSHLRYMGSTLTECWPTENMWKEQHYQSVMKALAATGTEQRHLFLLYQSVVLSATDYRLGLTTMAL